MHAVAERIERVLAGVAGGFVEASLGGKRGWGADPPPVGHGCGCSELAVAAEAALYGH
ncbi:MAG: hypothetical protein OXR73_01935 [Myxococcales bacterium]|nr:hypothetical protein [Myxococcales bacterium]